MKGGNNMIVKATALLTLVGVAGSGLWAVDGRYAKSHEFAQHVQNHSEERRELRREVLETRRALIETQIYEIRITRQLRPLIPLERQRLEQLETDLEHLNELISSLIRGAS